GLEAGTSGRGGLGGSVARGGSSGVGGTNGADIDECANGSADCDAHAECTNTAGSFTCTCDSGYVGDGVSCTPLRAVSAVSAGGTHTCAVLNTGSVRCWGFNQSGEPGYANTQANGDNETPASAGDV